jgi:hypothetical protein
MFVVRKTATNSPVCSETIGDKGRLTSIFALCSETIARGCSLHLAFADRTCSSPVCHPFISIFECSQSCINLPLTKGKVEKVGNGEKADVEGASAEATFGDFLDSSVERAHELSWCMLERNEVWNLHDNKAVGDLSMQV